MAKKVVLNVDLIYPVGAIYLSTSAVNPKNIFGGTWKQIKDRFLLACGSTYGNGSTGGEATHKLKVIEMPSHTHDWYGAIDGGSDAGQKDKFMLNGWGEAKWWGNLYKMDNTGGSQPHNNMPPYLAVYMWERTS